MTDVPAQTLFAGTEFPTLQDRLRQEAIDEINSMPAPSMLSLSDDDVVRYLTDKYALSAPTIDRAGGRTEQYEGLVPAYAVPNPNFSRHVPGINGTIYTLWVPYSGDRSMFFVRPSYSDMTAPHAVISDSHVGITTGGVGLKPEQIDFAFDRALDSIERHLNWLRSNVDIFNQSIPQFAKPVIAARRSKLLDDQKTAASLKYPLRRRLDAPTTYTVPAVRKKIVPTTPAAPTKPATDLHPTLADEHYREILRIIENMTLVMERSPHAFFEMEEEVLRFHYLVQLNGQYEGQATGETFNYRGKTDILVRYEGANIFVAECKFWDGAKALSETVDQLLSYTTWRDTKTAIVIFSKRKDFSHVLDEAQKAMKEHTNYKSGPDIEGETRFRYFFSHREDTARDIIITLLVFNIRPPSEFISPSA